MFSIIIGFIIVLAVLVEQFYRNRRFEMLYYKNDHRFSIVVAIRFYHPGLERLLEHAKKSKHQWIFVNINEAINRDDYPELTIKSMWIDSDPRALESRTMLLSNAYQLGYPDTQESFLLFMDAVTRIQKFKTLDFMANNLVEHQLFTAKPTRLRKSIKDGHSIFFDLLNDMNLDRNDINYHFFAIKRETYILAGCDESEYTNLAAFEDAIFKKNISVTHINHAESLEQVIEFRTYKESMRFYVNGIIEAERLKGLNIMPLMMLALHVFYVILILEFSLLSGLFYLLVHLLIYIVYRPFLQHNIVSYLLIPIYLLYFDIMLAFSLMKRLVYRRNKNKKPKELKEIKDYKIADDVIENVEEIPNEEVIKEDTVSETATAEVKKEETTGVDDNENPKRENLND